jgi:hypothetical protein
MERMALQFCRAVASRPFQQPARERHAYDERRKQASRDNDLRQNTDELGWAEVLQLRFNDGF